MAEERIRTGLSQLDSLLPGGVLSLHRMKPSDWVRGRLGPGWLAGAWVAGWGLGGRLGAGWLAGDVARGAGHLCRQMGAVACMVALGQMAGGGRRGEVTSGRRLRGRRSTRQPCGGLVAPKPACAPQPPRELGGVEVGGTGAGGAALPGPGRAGVTRPAAGGALPCVQALQLSN